MRRNIHEVLEKKGIPEAERVRKLKSLARLIEAETATLRHDADFMDMGYNTSVDAVAKGSDKLFRSARECLRGVVSWARKK